MCMLSSQTSSPPTPRAQIVPAPTSKNLPINQEPSFIRRDEDMDAPSQVGGAGCCLASAPSLLPHKGKPPPVP